SNLLSITTNNSPVQNGTYLRPTIDVSKTFSKFHKMQAGVNYLGENNQQRNKLSDSLTSFSFAFNVWQVYIKSDESKLNKWGISYFTRNDHYPIGKNLVKADRSDNFNFSTEILKNENHQLKFNVTYRKLQILNPALSRQKADESLLG